MRHIANVFSIDRIFSNRFQIIGPVESADERNDVFVVFVNHVDDFFDDQFPLLPTTRTPLAIVERRFIEQFVKRDSGIAAKV